MCPIRWGKPGESLGPWTGAKRRAGVGNRREPGHPGPSGGGGRQQLVKVKVVVASLRPRGNPPYNLAGSRCTAQTNCRSTNERPSKRPEVYNPATGKPSGPVVMLPSVRGRARWIRGNRSPTLHPDPVGDGAVKRPEPGSRRPRPQMRRKSRLAHGKANVGNASPLPTLSLTTCQRSVVNHRQNLG